MIFILIFVDPDVNYMDALAPYQPIKMRVVYCPIDTRLNFKQAGVLIRDHKPKNVVIPEVYTHPPVLHPGKFVLYLLPKSPSASYPLTRSVPVRV